MWVVKIVLQKYRSHTWLGKLASGAEESMRLVPMEITKTPVHHTRDLSVFSLLNSSVNFPLKLTCETKEVVVANS